MGYKLTEEHVRIRTTFGGKWIWELVTGEGHLITASEPFSDRFECEARARAHGVPVTGGRKTIKGRSVPRRQPGSRIFSDSRGLWKWEVVTPDGRVAAVSSMRFMTKEECERDLAENTQLAKLAVVGLSAAPARVASDDSSDGKKRSGVTVYEDCSQLWRWEWRDRDGACLAESSVAFLTPEECTRDAEARCEVAMVVVQRARNS